MHSSMIIMAGECQFSCSCAKSVVPLLVVADVNVAVTEDGITVEQKLVLSSAARVWVTFCFSAEIINEHHVLFAV